jgi:hypothetical protein
MASGFAGERTANHDDAAHRLGHQQVTAYVGGSLNVLGVSRPAVRLVGKEGTSV